MVLVLFLFVMQAVMERLHQNLPSNNKPEFHYFLNDKGCLTGQRTKSADTPFNIFHLLFIDSLMMVHSSSKAKKKWTNLLRLTMIISKCVECKSHTNESMCFPPFRKKQLRKWKIKPPQRPTTEWWNQQYTLHSEIQIPGITHHDCIE